MQGYPYLADPNFFCAELNTPGWQGHPGGQAAGASSAYVSMAALEVHKFEQVQMISASLCD